jgi:preprotein translocase subunit YajC
VIGGLAVIAILIFGFWYFMSYMKAQSTAKVVPEHLDSAPGEQVD